MLSEREPEMSYWDSFPWNEEKYRKGYLFDHSSRWFRSPWQNQETNGKFWSFNLFLHNKEPYAKKGFQNKEENAEVFQRLLKPISESYLNKKGEELQKNKKVRTIWCLLSNFLWSETFDFCVCLSGHAWSKNTICQRFPAERIRNWLVHLYQWQLIST